MPVISTNLAANTAVRYLNKSSNSLSTNIANLSSGSRISKASDDPAGLAIATQISSDLTTLEQASENASNSLAILQTADGGASTIADILERMVSLASEAASGTMTDDERALIQTEFSALLEEIDSTCSSTTYNGVSLLDGSSNFADETVETAATYDTGASAGYAAEATGEDASATFSINGTEITISSESDGTSTADMSAEDLAEAINSALHEQGDYTVSASVDAATGAIVYETVETGASASLEITGISGNASLLAAVGLSQGNDVSESGASIASDETGADVMVGSSSNDTINLSIQSITCEALGIEGLDLSSAEGASEALSLLSLAVDEVADTRASLGATMSRFEFRSSQIDTSIESLEAAESAIMDVDIAKEMAEMSSNSVRVKAAAAAVAQANEVPQYLLKLLQS
ncbi:flagellin [uncultured Cohaesibacter sp.]|uniref:flagellin n=1 Tax=uncultured Cohaesibacter sp. TaxID=1002546 RepID=UPI0029315157|nr:flagellin [uncultured Cohaesibacter sp.]